MRSPLSIYLQDHLAGATVAIDLLENMKRRFADEALGPFAAELLPRVSEDRESLRSIMNRVHAEPPRIKMAAAWLSGKGTLLKLGRRDDEGLGNLQMLETLALGVLGKRALWHALAEMAPHDERLRGVDLDRLVTRAEMQHALVEAQRLDIARKVLVSATAK